MKKSRIASPVPHAESPLRHLPLVDLLVDTKTELLELALRSGLKVFTTMLEEDRTAICGPRYAHEPERPASRAGTTRSEVVLGGRKVAIQRPRVRTAAGEVALPTFETMAATDPLDRRVVEQMLVGVATRQYARSLEPLGPEMTSRGTSKSAVSRRFVARTTAQLAAWQSAPLDALDLVALLIDGVHLGDHCLIVALGIAADGQKHALGLWDGSTENATVCQGLLANLQSRGLRTDRSLLVILDGSKALRKAVRATFGEAALVQRCQVHKMRNILEYLNDRQRPWAQAILRRAYQSADVKTAQRLLAGSRATPGDRASQRGRERPRRTRRDADRPHAEPLSAAAPLAGHHQRRGESAQSHASREAQRQALAQWADDAAVGRRGRPRSRQGLPSREGIC